MNTIVPQAWIIQEKIRRDKERQRKEAEDNSLPISLPEQDDEFVDFGQSGQEADKSTVVIIDL